MNTINGHYIRKIVIAIAPKQYRYKVRKLRRGILPQEVKLYAIITFLPDKSRLINFIGYDETGIDDGKSEEHLANAIKEDMEELFIKYGYSFSEQ